MKAGSLMGRLANGNEADSGTLVHAVPDSTGQYNATARAMCGAKPGRRSGGWDVDHYSGIGHVTCIRCVAKLQRAEQSAGGRVALAALSSVR